MMSLCLHNMLNTEARARLAPSHAELTFNNIIYVPLMFKMIMWLATIDSVATTEALHTNLRELPTYTTTVNSDIQKIHSYFSKKYSQLIAHSTTIDDAIKILFDNYHVISCHVIGYHAIGLPRHRPATPSACHAIVVRQRSEGRERSAAIRNAAAVQCAECMRAKCLSWVRARVVSSICVCVRES